MFHTVINACSLVIRSVRCIGKIRIPLMFDKNSLLDSNPCSQSIPSTGICETRNVFVITINRRNMYRPHLIRRFIVIYGIAGRMQPARTLRLKNPSSLPG